MRKKAKLTITLDHSTLSKIDFLVENKSFNNRSTAIQDMIELGFTKKLDTAVILAGGPNESDSSKVLKKINGQYLLSIIIDQLKKHGINRLVIVSGLNLSTIKKIFGNGQNFGIQIEYVQEKSQKGTAGGLKLAEQKINSQHFLVIYGDILTNVNFTSFIKFHFNEGRISTIGIKPRMGQRKYSQVLIEGNLVTDYIDKKTNVGLSLVNTGLYIFSKDIFKYLPPNKKLYLGKDLIPILVREEQMSAFIFQGIWFDISAKEDYQNAKNRWHKTDLYSS